MTLAMKPSLVELTAFSFFAATYLVGYQPPLKAAEQAGTETTANQFRVPNGQLTFDLEGLECPDPSDKCIAFHSRIPHVPSEESGVTIGRGEVDVFYWTVLAPDIVNPGREEQGSFSV
jgi:hypothetical protein